MAPDKLRVVHFTGAPTWQHVLKSNLEQLQLLFDLLNNSWKLAREAAIDAGFRVLALCVRVNNSQQRA
jgi:hypothetical protein